ncbi:hypothetical protein PVAP13_8KG274100 [Panicum virgatum]|uniref:FHA domain-containing protein n=1 Tax=Panicum virgatum TaxID=38727 RepID=A0A8T0PSC2_PANVG|nr:hypothetical protein PVAP13_8KG274100 [Panicum virgatum]
MGNPRRPAAAAMPASSEMEVGFAKLQGECFEYYMQTYSIILGRHSRRGSRKDPTAPAPAEADDGVDVDLGALGGGLNVSRRHARIFYDFPRRRFALQVLGKNGCLVEGVHHLPGSPPRQARLPGPPADGGRQVLLPPPVPLRLRRKRRAPAIPRSIPPPPSDDDEDNGKEQGEALAAAKYLSNGNDGRRSDAAGSKAYKEADDQLLLQLEEKDVISSAAIILSDLCGPQEWVSMNKLHELMFDKYSNLWHHSRVRKYLTSEDFPASETEGRPWHGLTLLLRKYPEHFVINISKAGGLSTEFVSLVSLQP